MSKYSYRRKIIYALLLIALIFYVIYKVVNLISSSLFIKRPDRINFILYGPETKYYSIDARYSQNYVIPFNPDVQVNVPGGYGKYRVGSIGKLAQLEKDKELIRKTFASTTTTFVHFAFYKSLDDIYYENWDEKGGKPSIKEILFSSSNASVLDRIYIAISLMNNTDNEFKLISYQKGRDDVLNDVIFHEDEYIKNSIGLLYQTRYRNDHESVQVRYPKDYRTAKRISSILEGNGIRVSDISFDIEERDRCSVIHSKEKPSNTAKDIGAYFGCTLIYGKTDVYDILFVLGEVERDWKISSN